MIHQLLWAGAIHRAGVAVVLDRECLSPKALTLLVDALRQCLSGNLSQLSQVEHTGQLNGFLC